MFVLMTLWSLYCLTPRLCKDFILLFAVTFSVVPRQNSDFIVFFLSAPEWVWMGHLAQPARTCLIMRSACWLALESESHPLPPSSSRSGTNSRSPTRNCAPERYLTLSETEQLRSRVRGSLFNPGVCVPASDLFLLALPGNARLRVVRRPPAGPGERNGWERHGRFPHLQTLPDQVGSESRTCPPPGPKSSPAAQARLHLFVPPQADHVMVHSDQDIDVVTGLRQKTYYGRPAWDKEFEQVRKENPT